MHTSRTTVDDQRLGMSHGSDIALLYAARMTEPLRRPSLDSNYPNATKDAAVAAPQNNYSRIASMGYDMAPEWANAYISVSGGFTLWLTV